MPLTIELLKVKDSPLVILGNRSNEPGGVRLVDSSSSIEGFSWLKSVKSDDTKGVFQKLTEDQLTTSLYFLLRESMTSELLMQQWFSDLGVNKVEGEELATFIYHTRINYLEELSDFIYHYADPLRSFSALNLDNLLSQLKSGNKLYWYYKNNSRELHAKNSDSKINLARLPEASFLMEDHDCIVIGFANSFTSFIEVILHSYPALLPELCSFVPLAERDTTAIGTLLEYDIRFLKYVSSQFKRVDFMGLDSAGRLKEWESFSASDDRTYNNMNNFFSPMNEQTVVPLFIKLIK